MFNFCLEETFLDLNQFYSILFLQNYAGFLRKYLHFLLKLLSFPHEASFIPL